MTSKQQPTTKVSKTKASRTKTGVILKAAPLGLGGFMGKAYQN